MLHPDPNKINLGVQHEKSQSQYHTRSHKKAEITSGDGGWGAGGGSGNRTFESSLFASRQHY